MADGEIWHLVEARRDDGQPAMFRIRDLAPRADQPKIFVVELPYPATELSRLPDAAAYRRLGQFEEQWLAPACAALGWTFVAAKIDDGSAFLYLYGADDPNAMIEKLSPFDPALGFFDEHDPTWDEYAALRELLDAANAMPAPALDVTDDGAPAAKPPKPVAKNPRPAPKRKPAPAPKRKPAPAPKRKPAPAPKRKPAPAPKRKPAPAPKKKRR